MALSKSIELDTTGIYLTYWRIQSFNTIIPVGGEVSTKIIVEGYLDQECFLADKTSAKIITLRAVGDMGSETGAYTFLKTWDDPSNPFFGAEDI